MELGLYRQATSKTWIRTLELDPDPGPGPGPWTLDPDPEKPGINIGLKNMSDFSPVGPLTSNGRLLNVHIGPLDVQKGRSMDV